MSETERNKEVVRRFIDEVVIGGKVELIDELCDPDAINHAAAAPNKRGFDGLKKIVGFTKAAQPDQKWTWQAVVAEGDLVIVYGVREATWMGKQFRGLETPQGRRIAVELSHLFRVKNGRIVEHWAVRDDLGLMQQLGVIAGPPVPSQISPPPSK
jgi:predicted ester cyclase